jgi:hypothetical protein
MRNNRTWGVLGKRQTFLSPSDILANKPKTPLNANPLDAWDTKKSKFRRVDLVPKVNGESDFQQAGVVPQVSSTPVLSPTPTGTPAVTPSPTPSATTPAFLTPDLWYDATNIGSIDYISSGGTDYVAAWRSVGTYQKVLTGTTTDTMPVWSGSSELPGSPLIVRFDKSATAGLRDFLTQRFDDTVVPVSGLTVFMVVANPGYNYSSSTLNANGFGIPMALYSGNTTNGGFTPTPLSAPINYASLFNSSSNNVAQYNFFNYGAQITNGFFNLSAASINNKFLYTQLSPYPSGLPIFTVNNSTSAGATNITGHTASNINAITLGTVIPNSAGTINTNVNAGAEVAEIMVFGRPLTAGEQTQVQNYLKAKWRYDEWSVIAPSPTPTQTNTPTPSVTQTPSVTPTQTGSPTPSPTTPAFDSDYQAILNYATANSITLPSAATQTLQNDLLVSLKTNNIWNKLDIFYVYAVNVEAFANINWKNPGTFTTGKSGAVSFISNKGYAGSAINGFLEFGYQYNTNNVNYTVTNRHRPHYD